MRIDKLIKELQKYPPEMEVSLFHVPLNDEDIIETLHPIFAVTTADIGCSEPEFLAKIGNGNKYLRIE